VARVEMPTEVDGTLHLCAKEIIFGHFIVHLQIISIDVWNPLRYEPSTFFSKVEFS